MDPAPLPPDCGIFRWAEVKQKGSKFVVDSNKVHVYTMTKEFFRILQQEGLCEAGRWNETPGKWSCSWFLCTPEWGVLQSSSAEGLFEAGKCNEREVIMFPVLANERPWNKVPRQGIHIRQHTYIEMDIATTRLTQPWGQDSKNQL